MVRRLARCVSLALFMWLFSHTASAQGRKLPCTEVKALNGKRVDVSTITNDGKPMIVLIWEITCAPCLTEFNSIARVYSDWQKETRVKIIAVSVDDNRSSPRVAPMARSKGWAWDTYLDVNQEFKRAMNVPLCPFAFVLNGAGEVVWQKGGYVPGDETVPYDVVKKVAAGKSLIE